MKKYWICELISSSLTTNTNGRQLSRTTLLLSFGTICHGSSSNLKTTQPSLPKRCLTSLKSWCTAKTKDRPCACREWFSISIGKKSTDSTTNNVTTKFNEDMKNYRDSTDIITQRPIRPESNQELSDNNNRKSSWDNILRKMVVFRDFLQCKQFYRTLREGISKTK